MIAKNMHLSFESTSLVMKNEIFSQKTISKPFNQLLFYSFHAIKLCFLLCDYLCSLYVFNLKLLELLKPANLNSYAFSCNS